MRYDRRRKTPDGSAPTSVGEAKESREKPLRLSDLEVERLLGGKSERESDKGRCLVTGGRKGEPERRETQESWEMSFRGE